MQPLPARTDGIWSHKCHVSVACPFQWIRRVRSSGVMRANRFGSTRCSPKPTTPRGGFMRWTSNGPRPRSLFRHALELNPSLTSTYTDFVFSTLLPEAKLDEALRELNDAIRADPLSADVRRTISDVQISAGLY